MTPEARAGLLNFSFTTEAVGENFNPNLPTLITATGTLSISETYVDLTYEDGLGNQLTGRAYAVTGITGTIVGAGVTASITGLMSYGDSWNGYGIDNRFVVLADGEGVVLAPTGSLILSLNRTIDGQSAVALSSDPFFGGFIDTANDSEWQGLLSLTPAVQPQRAPEPGTIFVMGIGLLAIWLAARAKRTAQTGFGFSLPETSLLAA